jgi:hypothetical protein
MTYPSDKWTDSELESLEQRIAQVFHEASEDLDKEVKAYFGKFTLRDKEMQALVKAGDMTQAEYQQWRMTQIGRGQRFEALRDRVAERYTDAHFVANQYVNDATPSLYALNRNYEAYTIEKAVGSCDFTLWDESTVRRLLVEEPDLMPYYPPSRALNRGIDLAFGKSQITKHVTSGIIRGLPPGKIANELLSNMENMSRDSAVRAARTGITAAQNAGRMDSYVAAEKMGIQIKRRWICTKDSRTRLSHGLADGQTVVGTKTPFVIGGYKMMFPGDSSMGAPGHEIYNCRCTTRTVEKDGIEAEPRQTRVRNPEWEKAKAEEDELSERVESLKEREKAETDPEKKKQLRKERKKAEAELTEARKKRQGTDKNVVVPEMTYPEWQNWKKSVANSGNGGTMAAKKPGTITTPQKTGNEKYNKLLDEFEGKGVDYVPVERHTGQPTESEIVSAISGGDKTKGSCASVGMAYIGQRHGYDTLDFRDGESREWFSGKMAKMRMWDALGVTPIEETSARSDLTNGKRILSKMVTGKEYYLSVGRHASIVRAIEAPVLDPITGEVVEIGTKYQYLELQSATGSGWRDFEDDVRDTLKWRFGCSSKGSDWNAAYLTDIDEIPDTDEFRTILGFINTSKSGQRKGTSGTIK